MPSTNALVRKSTRAFSSAGRKRNTKLRRQPVTGTGFRHVTIGAMPPPSHACASRTQISSRTGEERGTKHVSQGSAVALRTSPTFRQSRDMNAQDKKHYVPLYEPAL
jgi:hypothetical protein